LHQHDAHHENRNCNPFTIQTSRRSLGILRSRYGSLLHDSGIAVLRPLLLNAYPLNLHVAIALDNAGIIYGFLAVDEKASKCLLSTMQSAERCKGIIAEICLLPF
jgi:hypothetical protein